MSQNWDSKHKWFNRLVADILENANNYSAQPELNISQSNEKKLKIKNCCFLI